MEVESKMAANFIKVLSAVIPKQYVLTRVGKDMKRICSFDVKKCLLLINKLVVCFKF